MDHIRDLCACPPRPEGHLPFAFWLFLWLTRYFSMLDYNVPNVPCPDPHNIVDKI